MTIQPAPLAFETWGAPADEATALVLAVHGATGTHRIWTRLRDDRLASSMVIAPDLRGRGNSRDVAADFGIEAHLADLQALLKAMDPGLPLVLVGHSMGAFVAAALAHELSERVAGVVLVDGGLPLPAVPDHLVAERTERLMGGVLARLDATYANAAAYVAATAQLPSMAGVDAAYLNASVPYDTMPHPAGIAVKSRREAVLADSRDLLTNEKVRQAALGLPVSAILIRAERGVQNEPTPRISPDHVRAFLASNERADVIDVPDTNHFSILARPDAVTHIVTAINRLLTGHPQPIS